MNFLIRMLISEFIFLPCTENTLIYWPSFESIIQQQLSARILLNAYCTHMNQIPVFKHCGFVTCFNCYIGNISPFSSGTCDLWVPFELYVLTQTSHQLSEVTGSKGRAGNKGFLFSWFEEWVACKRYAVFILCMCWVFCLSLAILNSYSRIFGFKVGILPL